MPRSISNSPSSRGGILEAASKATMVEGERVI
ncbi:hypothetical protein NC652_019961 [Populus alba x Populus x berolinensis]|nr:hypothetical protein NC652_019961 [Populus alba x Populus x berolinensis]